MSTQVTNLLGYSPATIVVALMVDNLGVSTRIADGGEWPTFINNMPDKPDEAICVYDTFGMSDGKLMSTGETIIHPGFELLLRSREYVRPFEKAKSIATDFRNIEPANFSLLGNTYRIYNISQTDTVSHLGEDQSTIRRCLVSVNFRVTLWKL